MKKYFLSFLWIFFAMIFSSHDLFIKADSFFLKENQEQTLYLLNGTFETSENTVARERMVDARMIGGGKNIPLEANQWFDKDSITFLNLQTYDAGTYLIGVSIKPKMIELAAEAFNKYLNHDGILDILALRKKENQLDNSAKEKYSKHVKAILQVGEQRTDDFKQALDYPIEFIPLENPYLLKAGEEITVQLLLKGKPLTNQLVYFGGDFTKWNHSTDIMSRTNTEGKVKVKLPKGKSYFRTIYMIESEEKEIDYESLWATLTFEIK